MFDGLNFTFSKENPIQVHSKELATDGKGGAGREGSYWNDLLVLRDHEILFNEGVGSRGPQVGTRGKGQLNGQVAKSQKL